MPASTRRHRGAALSDVVAAVAFALLLAALAWPALAAARGDARITDSLDNLRQLGTAHGSYALDWNGRQFTTTIDTLAAFGDDAAEGFATYNGALGLHPPVTLGWGPDHPDGEIVFHQYRTQFVSNARLTEPFVFNGPSFSFVGAFGSFRLPNDARFTSYLNGRVYDPLFYAANEPVAWPLVEPLIDEPFQYVELAPVPGTGSIPIPSSYCRSAAALFDPAVMEARRLVDGEEVGGWRDPWSLDTGLRTPALVQTRYPHLKTMMLEHNWLQNQPANPCNPNQFGGFYPGDCEPWVFTQGLPSEPATLFYDGSLRLLANLEVLAADEIVQAGNGGSGFDGIWSRSTPLGVDAYTLDVPIEPGTYPSHHVLTSDGILGRDTLDPAAVADRAARLEARLVGQSPANRATSPRRRGLSASTPFSDMGSLPVQSSPHR